MLTSRRSGSAWILLMLAACLCVATPSLSAPESFTTDRPSPLKLAKPAKEPAAAVEFRGQAQISGSFQVEWTAKGRGHLRALFFPDKDSTGLLPYVAGTSPVEELLIANAEQAVAMLLEPATAQRILVKELLAAEGEARITIRDYRVVIDCDHRWYMARVIAAAKVEKVVAGVRQSASVGC